MRVRVSSPLANTERITIANGFFLPRQKRSAWLMPRGGMDACAREMTIILTG
jgi:hypothetical protein